MLAPHDQIAVNTLFILLLITGFGYWILVKYYSMAEIIILLFLNLLNLLIRKVSQSY